MSATTKPSRREQRAQAQHFIDTLEGTAFPNSKRIYITGSQPDIRIPMREIQLSPTLIGGSKDNPQFEDNEAVPVYDTSGPYGDPDVAINVQQGLAKLRQPWIAARNDSEELDDRSSAYTKERLADDGLDELRYCAAVFCWHWVFCWVALPGCKSSRRTCWCVRVICALYASRKCLHRAE